MTKTNLILCGAAQVDREVLTTTKTPASTNNYAVWWWSKWSKKWLLRGRFSLPQEAAAKAGEASIVVDVVSNRQIWWRGAVCSRAKPHAVPTLAIENYTD